VRELRYRVQWHFDRWIFVNGDKINGTYCHDVMLIEQLPPVMREISGEFFIFQHLSWTPSLQDS